MALLDYNEIKAGKYIVYKDEPYEVLDNHVARTQQRKPQNQVKMRSMINGRAVNETFHVTDSIEEADITKRDVKYLYTNKNEFWFCNPDKPAERFTLTAELIGNSAKFLKDNTIISSLVFEYDGEEKVIGIKLPIKMEFIIKECAPNIKGSTASGGNKPATLENGAVVNVPLFLNQGEKILVNTDTGEYVERVT
ncbi:hypothetical protein A3J61_00935 [Candidatus Nomurabacteria bacterium RIFCSPHIGHO2_02_FULL_38_15]|uniref:Elongation factor P n=1 Tax=Candidatus Nomurabacteria bacterium RIFCSPHIGHO2_02_FULL_38_15 TaxID=1801752 RepID=A0A1F6VRA8_9BACT|nr:MAG: hypothetical protein A3J61_00935 [Candidatus Nomurabacteria bacterium RIFCSPHIGHO2_02_FULL_38_15]